MEKKVDSDNSDSTPATTDAWLGFPEHWFIDEQRQAYDLTEYLHPDAKELTVRCIPEALQCHVIPGTNVIIANIVIIRQHISAEQFLLDVTSKVGDKISSCIFGGTLATEDSLHVKREITCQEETNINSSVTGSSPAKLGESAGGNKEKFAEIDFETLWSVSSQQVGPLVFYTSDDEGKELDSGESSGS
jgi:hypothetical protein